MNDDVSSSRAATDTRQVRLETGRERRAREPAPISVPYREAIARRVAIDGDEVARGVAEAFGFGVTISEADGLLRTGS